MTRHEQQHGHQAAAYRHGISGRHVSSRGGHGRDASQKPGHRHDRHPGSSEYKFVTLPPLGPDAPLWQRSAYALAMRESGGDTHRLNMAAVSTKGTIGISQVMPANIPGYTEKYYGKPLTPAQYRGNLDAQIAVTEGEAYDKIEVKRWSPEQYFQAWHCGSLKCSLDKGDGLTSTGNHVRMTMANLAAINAEIDARSPAQGADALVSLGDDPNGTLGASLSEYDSRNQASAGQDLSRTDKTASVETASSSSLADSGSGRVTPAAGAPSRDTSNDAEGKITLVSSTGETKTVNVAGGMGGYTLQGKPYNTISSGSPDPGAPQKPTPVVVGNRLNRPMGVASAAAPS